jgi:hypothetical protein
MELLIAAPTIGQFLPIALLVLVLGIIWIIVRFVLRLAKRIFALGCFAILVLGAILLIPIFLN